MKTNREELIQLIKLGRLRIDNHPMETENGTKKVIRDYHSRAIKERNILINEELLFVKETNNIVMSDLLEIVEKISPKDNTLLIEKREDRVSFLRSALPFFDHRYNMLEFLPLKKIICLLKDRDHIDLDEVNELLMSTITTFTSAGVTLTASDFNYSMFTKQYMEKFYENNAKLEFSDVMKDTFEHIYWECPKLITHLRLNILYLVQRFDKDLTRYGLSLRQEYLKDEELTEKSYLELYRNKRNELDLMKRKDEYLNTQLFLTEQLRIDDYLPSSMTKDLMYNTFLESGISFLSLSPEEKASLYEKLTSLEKTLTELEHYLHFESMIRDVIERYKKKDTIKGLYSSKLKEIAKEEQSREKLFNKYEKSRRPSLFGNSNKRKGNLVRSEMNTKVELLAKLYDELEESSINEKIANTLDDGSPIKELLHLVNSSYSYLRSFFDKYDEEKIGIETRRFYDFCFSPYNDFTRRITILSDVNFTSLVIEKYRLLNIIVAEEMLTLDNLGLTIKKIKGLLKEYEIASSNISIRTIELIYRVNKKTS